METFHQNSEPKTTNEVRSDVADRSQLNSLAVAAENRFDALALLKDHAITQTDLDRDLNRKDLPQNDRLVDTFLKDNFPVLSTFQSYGKANEQSPAITKEDLRVLEMVTNPDGLRKWHEAKLNKAGHIGEDVGLLASIGFVLGGAVATMTVAGAPLGVPMITMGTVWLYPSMFCGDKTGRALGEKGIRNEVNYYLLKEQQALHLTVRANSNAQF